jgi:vacuolar-type H+-ATPase subunit E/Vma4
MDDWQIRIENKIDRLSDAVIQLARVDERVQALTSRTDLVEERLEKLSDKLDLLDNTSTKQGTVFAGLGHAFWYVFSAVSSAAVATLFFWMNNG